MKKLAPAQQFDAMIPLIMPLTKDCHFGFGHIFSVCKRLKAKVSKSVINEYKRIMGVFIDENELFIKICGVAKIGEVRE